VAALVDAPSADREEVQPLTAAEARDLLAAPSATRNGARWSVGRARGRRQGEALGLTWDDVNLDSGTVTVRRALQRVRGKSS
jgi:integrase